MASLSAQKLAFTFGLLGNIVSFLVFLAPIPTFYSICKKKSSEGFHSTPYSVAFFSASLLLYYACLKAHAYMIIIINVIGCAIEMTYLLIYIIHATKKAKIFTMRSILIFNVGGLGAIVLVSLLFFKGVERLSLVGWTCATVNVAVFAAPLSIMRKVITTKSVEFMPFTLSLFLVLCAAMWFFYGIFIKDYYIALPNVLGFLFGIAQMILYFIYNKGKKGNETENFELEERSVPDSQSNIEKNSNFKENIGIDNVPNVV